MTNHHEQHLNMVTLPRSVVEQTLEVLVDALGGVYYPDQKVVIDALRQALAAKQHDEPVFWYRPVCGGEMYEGPHHSSSKLGRMLREEEPGEWKPLYTHQQPVTAGHQPARQRLTNVQIEQHAHRMCTRYGHSSDPLISHTYTFNRSNLLQFARAIEEGKHP